MIPAKVPQLTHDVRVTRAFSGVAEKFKVRLLGIRGYYWNTMGKPGQNDYGIYDDALIVVSPTAYATFNANTDPSKLGPRTAVLREGLWWYKIGIHGLTKPEHQRYVALVQQDRVVVLRGPGQVPDGPGFFGINIHRGGATTTGSEGCQTIVPGQWAGFITLVKTEMARHQQIMVPYRLLTWPQFAALGG